MTKSIDLMKTYKSPQLQWERYSSIRTRPRRLVGQEENTGYYFPPAKQPLLVHPKLGNITEEQKKYILTQSLFKYMNDIANIEKDVINKAAYGITKDFYSFEFSPLIKRDALTIIIDETYHAYVAIDFMYQIADHEKISILDLPDETELSLAIKTLSMELTSPQRLDFELIAVAIAEHALTTDLIAVAKAKDVCKTFYYVMHDHVLDEKRHAKYFEKVLQVFWSSLTYETQNVIAPLLPKLISHYMSPNIQKQFDRSILQALLIDKGDIEEILETTHFGWNEFKIDNQNLIVEQMIILLQQTNILDHPIVKSEFERFGVKLSALEAA